MATYMPLSEPTSNTRFDRLSEAPRLIQSTEPIPIHQFQMQPQQPSDTNLYQTASEYPGGSIALRITNDIELSVSRFGRGGYNTTILPNRIANRAAREVYDAEDMAEGEEIEEAISVQRRHESENELEEPDDVENSIESYGAGRWNT